MLNKMDKKPDSSSQQPPPAPPSSVGDYDDSQSTYTVDQPPPAYRKPEVPAVKLAKIVAATILLVTFIIGLTSVAIVYVQQNMKCAEMLIVHHASSTGPEELPDMPAKLAQRTDDATSTTTTKSNAEEDGNGDSGGSADKLIFSDLMGLESEDKPRQLNFPIHIDMDELTGKMMEKNQRARLNCVIEKKRSEEIIPRAPKTLQTPFGNLTTDPKFTHVTGETMSLTCRSGNDRVSRPAAGGSEARGNVGSSPILIQIPLQQQQPRGSVRPLPHQQMRPPMAMPQMRTMQQETSLPALLGPLQALHEIQRMHQQRQQQQQQQERQQLQEQRLGGGGMMLLPPPHMQGPPSDLRQLSNNLREEPEDQQQEQQRILPQLARHFSMPLLPLPQISLHQMLPQLLEVHKQLQQERHREEEQQQQQQQREGNGHDEPHRDEDRDEDRRRPAAMHDIQLPQMHRIPPPQHLQQQQQHLEGFFGRPPPQQQQQPPQMPPQPQQHLEQNRGSEEMSPQLQEQQQHIPLPHHVQQQQQPQQHEVQQPHESQRTPKELMDEESDEEGAARAAAAASNHQQQQHQQQQQQQQQHPHQEHMGIQLEVAPSFHGPQIVPAADMMMMSRAMQHPAPFLVGSHNMQPRSSARPRMKREAMAGSCSCVCK